jgi:hypothetical protein
MVPDAVRTLAVPLGRRAAGPLGRRAGRLSKIGLASCLSVEIIETRTPPFARTPSSGLQQRPENDVGIVDGGATDR